MSLPFAFLHHTLCYLLLHMYLFSFFLATLLNCRLCRTGRCLPYLLECPQFPITNASCKGRGAWRWYQRAMECLDHREAKGLWWPLRQWGVIEGYTVSSWEDGEWHWNHTSGLRLGLKPNHTSDGTWTQPKLRLGLESMGSSSNPLSFHWNHTPWCQYLLKLRFLHFSTKGIQREAQW